MALTRKYLKEIGIESEKIDLIIEAHTDTVDAIKTERDGLKAEADKVAGLTAKVAELESKALTDSEWKSKFEEVSAQFESFKTQQSEKDALASKESAYRKLLREVGISDKRIDTIIKVTDIAGIELVDGQIKDADALTESIKSEWGDFITTTDTKGATTIVPPETHTSPTYTHEEIARMSPDEINANWEAIKNSMKG